VLYFLSLKAQAALSNVTYIRFFPSIFHINKTVSGREDDAMLTGLMMMDNYLEGIWGGGKWAWPNLSLCPGIGLEGLRKPRNMLVRRAEFRVKI
jgi:hypothetical protein